MAAGSTYTPIATTTLGSAQSSITFSSFSGYTDLVLVNNSTCTINTQVIGCQYNNDTGTNYSKIYLLADGSTAFSGGNINENYAVGGEAYNTLNTNIHYFFNYANTTTYKTAIVRSNNAGNRVGAWVNLWRNTAAITTIKIFPLSGSFDTGSTFTLYGIAAA